MLFSILLLQVGSPHFWFPKLTFAWLPATKRRTTVKRSRAITPSTPSRTWGINFLRNGLKKRFFASPTSSSLPKIIFLKSVTVTIQVCQIESRIWPNFRMCMAMKPYMIEKGEIKEKFSQKTKVIKCFRSIYKNRSNNLFIHL